METIAMHPNGDLYLSKGTTVRIDGAQCARQQIESRLALFLGEWFLDVRKGVPYYRDVLGQKTINRDAFASVLEQEILSVPDVVSVPLIEIGDIVARKVSVTWEAVLIDGTVLTSLPEAS